MSLQNRFTYNTQTNYFELQTTDLQIDLQEFLKWTLSYKQRISNKLQ
jgi:hypothetical protein